ncbi:hypothetical protein K435DRAFT_812765, partial [Dendrothele bispora CBS 962.96]
MNSLHLFASQQTPRFLILEVLKTKKYGPTNREKMRKRPWSLPVWKNLKNWYGLTSMMRIRNEIQVNGEDGMIFNVDGTIPEYLKSNLLESLNLALRGYSSEDQLTERDTTDNPAFTALHFSYHSKYGTNGASAPKDVHPYKMKNKHTKKTNHSQFLTRESNDMRDHPEHYRRICDALEPVLRWIVDKKLRSHPDLFSDIELEVDIFPLQDTNPVRPFSSFVLNLN